MKRAGHLKEIETLRDQSTHFEIEVEQAHKELQQLKLERECNPCQKDGDDWVFSRPAIGMQMKFSVNE